MSWMLPSALGIAAAAAVVAVALHFIARSRPLAEPLPTARFVPLRPVHARTRSIAFTDLMLLLLRIAAVLALGLAVAGPVVRNRGRVARIVMVDRSRAVANIGESRDSVRSIATANDVIVAFDSAARRLATRASLDSLAPSGAAGSVSAALAAAVRVAASPLVDADSVELVLVSPLAREELDGATSTLRVVWPGRIRVVPVGAVASHDARSRVDVRAAPNDALAAAVSLMGIAASNGDVRLVRSDLTSQDSAWTTQSGHVLVHWPARDDGASWTKRATIDAIGGVTTGASTVVGRFPRLWVLTGDAVARWSDGEPAAVEHAVGAGCIRDVGVLIDDASDLALRAPFRRFAADLFVPCGGVRATAPIDSVARASIAGAGMLAPMTALRDASAESSKWSPWLLVLGAGLLTLELAIRRTKGRA